MRRLSKITASITVGVASFLSFTPHTGFTSPGPVPAHVTSPTVRLGSSEGSYPSDRSFHMGTAFDCYFALSSGFRGHWPDRR